ILAYGGTLHSHEIGTTRVIALFNGGRSYDVEITTDAAALLEKLQASVGSEPSSETAPGRLRALLAGSAAPSRRRLPLALDASDVRPAIAYGVTMPSGGGSAVATIRLTGAIPHGARQFTWAYAWTFASYALTIRTPSSGNPSTEWLDGG